MGPIVAPKAMTTNEFVKERQERWRRKYFVIIILFWGEGYKSGGWTRKDWEMSGIGVQDVKFPKDQFKQLC